MVYMKNFPEKRRPFFLAIICNHLASTELAVDSNERTLFEKMATRLLSTAAAKAPNDDLSNGISELNLKGSTPKGQAEARVLQDVREVLLLVEIFKDHGMAKEALAALNDPRIGTSSRLGRGNWTMALEKIKLQRRCESWDALWTFCYNVLLEARPIAYGAPKIGSLGDDWQTWTGLIEASTKIGTSTNAEATENLINSYLNHGEQISRHARLAQALYYAKQSPDLLSAEGELYLTCINFYHQHCVKTTCFKSLPYVHVLQLHQQQIFLESAQRRAMELQHAKDTQASVSLAFAFTTPYCTHC